MSKSNETQCEAGRSAPCLRHRWRWEHSEIRGGNKLKQKRSLKLRLERDTLMSKCHLCKRRPPSKPVREQQPRYSPVMRLTGNFAVPASKMKNQSAARAWNRKNLRLCVDWLLGIHGSRNINSATLACRAPLLTRVLNVVTASSPAVSAQSVSSANCMQKDEEAFNCSNQCWEILRQHVRGGRGRKKIPAGDERGERIESGYRNVFPAGSAGASTLFSS